jgi:hypothetical protein
VFGPPVITRGSGWCCGGFDFTVGNPVSGSIMKAVISFSSGVSNTNILVLMATASLPVLSTMPDLELITANVVVLSLQSGGGFQSPTGTQIVAGTAYCSLNGGTVPAFRRLRALLSVESSANRALLQSVSLPFVTGDCNGDGYFNANDATFAQNCVTYGPSWSSWPNNLVRLRNCAPTFSYMFNAIRSSYALSDIQITLTDVSYLLHASTNRVFFLNISSPYDIVKNLPNPAMPRPWSASATFYYYPSSTSVDAYSAAPCASVSGYFEMNLVAISYSLAVGTFYANSSEGLAFQASCSSGCFSVSVIISDWPNTLNLSVGFINTATGDPYAFFGMDVGAFVNGNTNFINVKGSTIVSGPFYSLNYSNTKPPSLAPTLTPTLPTSVPSIQPSPQPSRTPSSLPSSIPSGQPSLSPSFVPSSYPTAAPSFAPSIRPSMFPINQPTLSPSLVPSTAAPSFSPSIRPSMFPINQPTLSPSLVPSKNPTAVPSFSPSITPSMLPTNYPSWTPSRVPSSRPSAVPTREPTLPTTQVPTVVGFVPTYAPALIRIVVYVVPLAATNFNVTVTLEETYEKTLSSRAQFVFDFPTYVVPCGSQVPFQLSYVASNPAVTCQQSPENNFFYKMPSVCAQVAGIVSYQTFFLMCSLAASTPELIPVVGSTSLQLPAGLNLDASNTANFTDALATSLGSAIGLPTSDFVVSLTPDGRLSIVFLPGDPSAVASGGSFSPSCFSGNLTLLVNYNNETLEITIGPFQNEVNSVLQNSIIAVIAFLGPGVIVGICVPLLLGVALAVYLIKSRCPKARLLPILKFLLSAPSLAGNVLFFIYLWRSLQLRSGSGTPCDPFIYPSNRGLFLALFWSGVSCIFICTVLNWFLSALLVLRFSKINTPASSSTSNPSTSTTGEIPGFATPTAEPEIGVLKVAPNLHHYFKNHMCAAIFVVSLCGLTVDHLLLLNTRLCGLPVFSAPYHRYFLHKIDQFSLVTSFCNLILLIINLNVSILFTGWSFGVIFALVLGVVQSLMALHSALFEKKGTV